MLPTAWKVRRAQSLALSRGGGGGEGVEAVEYSGGQMHVDAQSQLLAVGGCQGRILCFG